MKIIVEYNWVSRLVLIIMNIFMVIPLIVLPLYLYGNDNDQTFKDSTKNTLFKQQAPRGIHLIKGFFSSAVSPLIKNGFDWNPTPVKSLETIANHFRPDAYQIYTLGKIAAGNVLLGCIRGIGAYKSEKVKVIEINNIEDLMKIGNDTDYPSDGYCKLTASFNASSFENPIENFSGTIDGQGHTISKLPCCLIEKLIGFGVIKNIIINEANINSQSCAAVIAGSVEGNALISSIRLENSMLTSIDSLRVGMVTERIGGLAIIKNVTVINGTLVVDSKRHIDAKAGLVAGVIKDTARVSNTLAIDCNITLKGQFMNGGVAAGSLEDFASSNFTTAINCLINASGFDIKIAIGGGLISGNAASHNNRAFNCRLSSDAMASNAAIGGAMVISSAESNNNLAVNCTIEANNNVAIGGAELDHSSKSNNNIGVNCTIKATGFGGSAFLGGRIFNSGESNNNLGSNCTLESVSAGVTKIDLTDPDSINTLCKNLDSGDIRFFYDDCTLNQQAVDAVRYTSTLTTAPSSVSPSSEATHAKAIYSNETTASYSNKITTPYVNETTTPYTNEATTLYVNEATTSYVNEATTPYTNEATTLYVNEATTPYTNEIINSSMNASALAILGSETAASTLMSAVGGVVAITGAIGLAALGYSYYGAYLKGKTGTSFLFHPIKSCHDLFGKYYKYCYDNKSVPAKCLYNKLDGNLEANIFFGESL